MAAALLSGAAVVAFVLLTRDPSGSSPDGPGADGTSATENYFTEKAPWRLVLHDQTSSDGSTDIGCQFTLTNDKTGSDRTWESLFGTRSYQMQESGTFRYRTSDPGCIVTHRTGAGAAELPFTHSEYDGDTDVFESPGVVSVDVLKYPGCELTLKSAADGQTLAIEDTQEGGGPVTLDSNGPARVYIAEPGCRIRIEATD